MLKIGITGGIGSGKTTVAKLFETLGVPVFYADAETRMLQNSDPELRAELIAAFGTEAYQPDGNLNRAFIAKIVFADKNALAKINSIVHPAVARHFNNWRSAHTYYPYILKEAAILFESGSDKGLDGVITVAAPEEIRIKRVMQRDGVSEAEVRKRIANQWPEEEKIKRSKWIITNDGSPLEPQVQALHQKLHQGF
ncbi:MAG: dephospho-CoA kinase [Bacteroidia bacterium]